MSETFLPSWVVVPAAGIGRRMQADKPKQYLQLGQQTVLENTLHRLSAIPNIKGLVIALSKDDPYWDHIVKPGNVKIITVVGGKERYDSVMSALNAISQYADANDWVMVHDAARPCFVIDDIAKLHTAIRQQKAIGGLLGLPVADTLKRVNAMQEVIETVNREQLWHALTPQMFSYAVLSQALDKALQDGVNFTDDSQVIELMNEKPIIVESSPMNIKITRPDDLRLAEMYLQELQK